MAKTPYIIDYAEGVSEDLQICAHTRARTFWTLLKSNYYTSQHDKPGTGKFLSA
jgi:hypothetical protein